MVSIIIVTYNSGEYIRRCLLSIVKYIESPHEIIIVDNHSTDNTIEKIKETKIKVSLVEQEINGGYSKANNKGAEKAVGELLFFLNPDTEVLNNSVNDLFKYLNNHQDIGIIAPKLIQGDSKVQLSVRHFPTLWGVFKEYLFNQKNTYNAYAPSSDEPVEVDVVYAAAILIPKNIFKLVNGFDEKYFLYYEDIDLCKKIRKIGNKIIYYPQVSLRHQIGGSGENLEKGSSYNYLVQSANIYHGVIQAFLIRFFLYILQKL